MLYFQSCISLKNSLLQFLVIQQPAYSEHSTYEAILK
jgi:hypothetical protein